MASVHPTADRSEYSRQLKSAENSAKQQKLRRWKDYVEEKEEEQRVEEERAVCINIFKTLDHRTFIHMVVVSHKFVLPYL